MRGEVTYLFVVVVFSACRLFLTLSLLFKCRFVAWRRGFPENFHRVVYVVINKRSFECFVCLDLILERLQSFWFLIIVWGFSLMWVFLLECLGGMGMLEWQRCFILLWGLPDMFYFTVRTDWHVLFYSEDCQRCFILLWGLNDRHVLFNCEDWLTCFILLWGLPEMFYFTLRTARHVLFYCEDRLPCFILLRGLPDMFYFTVRTDMFYFTVRTDRHILLWGLTDMLYREDWQTCFILLWGLIDMFYFTVRTDWHVLFYSYCEDWQTCFILLWGLSDVFYFTDTVRTDRHVLLWGLTDVFYFTHTVRTDRHVLFYCEASV